MIIDKWLYFNNKIEDMEYVGKIVVSYDSEGKIWHEIKTKKDGIFIMVYNGVVVSKDRDKTMISPIEGSSVYMIDNDNVKVGEYVVNVDNEIVKADVGNILFPVVDTELNIVEETKDSTAVRNEKKRIVVEINKIRENIKSLSGEYENEFAEDIKAMNEKIDKLKIKMRMCDELIDNLTKNNNEHI